MADGTFTPTALAKTQVMLGDLMGAPNSVNRLYLGFEPVTAKALRQIQAAKDIQVRERKEGSGYKKRVVTVGWVEQDTVTVNDGYTVACNPTGEEAGTYAQDYDLTGGLNASVAFDTTDSIGNMVDEMMVRAQQLLQLDYEMSKTLNDRAIAFLDANVGTSVYVPTGWTSDSSGIEVEDANYTKMLQSHFELSNRINNLNGGLTIGGAKLWLAFNDAVMNNANSDTKDQFKRFQEMYGLTFDIKGLIADTENPIYQVSPFACAVVDYNVAPASGVVQLTGRVLYRIPSQFLPGVYWDIVEQRACVNNQHDKITLTASLQSQIFLNPKSINDANNKGIVKWYQPAA